MDGRRNLGAAIGMAILLAGCGGDGPATPEEPELVVRIVVPAAIPEKSVLDVQAHIVRARGVEPPIVVSFEKANAGEPFNGAGFVILHGLEERVAVARIPIFKDPTIRATARDASGLESTSMASIDVLEFP